MSWFGSSDPSKLIENRDWVGLWKHWRKKNPKEPRYLEHADDLWDATQVDFKTSRDILDVGSLAQYLISEGHAYAGARQALTPIEYMSRMRVDLERKPRDPAAMCPACDHYLSEDPTPAERGMFRACAACSRLVHRDCGAKVLECPKCKGAAWTWSLRIV